jgi:ribosomal-protein-alanine N-acetyltransferase
LRLRGYRSGDLDAMHALDVVCFDPPFRFSRSAMRRFAEAKRARVVLAEEEQILAGFVILHREESAQGPVGYVVTLDVAPEFRRRGVATQLMREAERLAHKEGCLALALHVFTENHAAARFYAQDGFLRAHREEGFYGASRDAWVFYKPLRDSGD